MSADFRAGVLIGLAILAALLIGYVTGVRRGTAINGLAWKMLDKLTPEELAQVLRFHERTREELSRKETER